MGQLHRIQFLSRWFIPALAFMLLFGHVCEAGSYLERLVPFHEHEHQHHPADHHAGDVQVWCDAVDAVSNSGGVQMNSRADLGVPVLTDDPDTARPVSSPRHEVVPKLLSRRPPLFLLHAALLI